MAESDVFVLDAFAMLAYFNAEPGYEIVRRILRETQLGRSTAFMSEINWGELYYITAKKINLSEADLRVQQLERLAITLVPVTRIHVRAAALLKINYSTSKNSLSYADCLAAALAQDYAATFVTGDPEFKALNVILSIKWLPAPRRR